VKIVRTQTEVVEHKLLGRILGYTREDGDN